MPVEAAPTTVLDVRRRFTHNIETLGEMSCNPPAGIGGIGKDWSVKTTPWAEQGSVDGGGPDAHAEWTPAGACGPINALRLCTFKIARRQTGKTENSVIFQGGRDDLDWRQIPSKVWYFQNGKHFQHFGCSLRGTFSTAQFISVCSNHQAGRMAIPRPIVSLRNRRKSACRWGSEDPVRLPGHRWKDDHFAGVLRQTNGDKVPYFPGISPWLIPNRFPKRSPEPIPVLQQRLFFGKPDVSDKIPGAIVGVAGPCCPFSAETKIVWIQRKRQPSDIFEPEG